MAGEGRDAARDADQWWFSPAFETLNDLIALVDASGTVIYVNPYAIRTSGFDRDQLVGVNIIEHLHPDDLARAFEVLSHMADDSLGVDVTPAMYRFRTADGWTPVEINGAVIERDGEELVLIMGRSSGDRDLQDQVFELLTTGTDIDTIIELLPQFGTWRHPDDHYGILYDDGTGNRVAVGTEVMHELVPLGDGHAPWDKAAATGDEIVIGLDDLPDDVRAAASERGLTGCWAVPVDDPLVARPAVIVAWDRKHGGARESHRFAIQTMARSLRLVLQWREQVTRLRLAASRDPLTGLPNRAGFFERASEVLRAPDDGDGADGSVTVLYIDLDDFKSVNDVHGHLTGDRVLVAAAERIAHVIRPGDTVARLGGDEFAVLCQGGDQVDATAIATRIVGALEQPFVVDGLRVSIGASVGISKAPGRDPDVDRLLASADGALYRAKHDGKGRWVAAAEPAGGE